MRLIRQLLATVGVAVGTDTIARFLAEVNIDPMSQQPARRTVRQRVAALRPARPHPAVVSLTSSAPQQPSASDPALAEAPPSDAPPERSRIRGPRIADPRNL